jgi:hypothetical protein
VPDGAPLYRPIVEHLPAVYQEDAASYAQVSGYLGLVDDLARAYAAELDELTSWLGPDARDLQPPGLPAAAPPDEVFDRYAALYDELASWFGFTFPESWADPADREGELDRKRAFLTRAAHLWRRRGTPRGFYAWLCFYFELETDRAARPALIEHFAVRASAADPDEGAYTITLLVPRGAAFASYRRRRELVRFVDRYAPAHLLTRICWVAPGQLDELWPAPAATLAQKRTKIQAILDQLGDYTPEADGIHLERPPFSDDPLDRLGQGTLPGPADLEDA